MLRYFSIASGSSGNCSLLSDGAVHILIDAGISARRIATTLAKNELKLEDILYVLVTHGHEDHIRGLDTLYSRYGIKIITNKPTAYEIANVLPKSAIKAVYNPGAAFGIGNIRIQTFSIPHDTACCSAFRFTGRTGESIGFATDLGVVPDELLKGFSKAGLVILEANYDEEMLLQGSYPQNLKRRIMANNGHLCNSDCAAAIKKLADKGTKYFALAHLSKENNTPEKVLECIKKAAGRDDIHIRWLPRDEAGPVYVLEKDEIWSVED